MRPALCGPHARLRWRSRLRLRMSGLLARAWERSVSLPSALMLNPPTTNPQFNRPISGDLPALGRDRAAGARPRGWTADLAPGLPALRIPNSHTVRARAFPACPPACRPSRLSLPSGAARPVAPPANRLSSWERVATSWESVAPNLAPQPGFLPRRWRGRSLPSPCTRLRSLGPRMSPEAPATRSRSLVILGLGQGVGFLARFRVHPASSGPSESCTRLIKVAPTDASCFPRSESAARSPGITHLVAGGLWRTWHQTQFLSAWGKGGGQALEVTAV
jgi:hypothetical protein